MKKIDKKTILKQIKTLINDNKLDEALNLCLEHQNYERVISQQINILINQNKLEEALNLCLQHPSNEVIVSQQITILIKQNRLDEALNICKNHLSYDYIRSQQVNILIRQNKLEEALDICLKYRDYEPILSQLIIVLVKLNRMDDAINICRSHLNVETIASQYVTLLIKQNKIEEALKVCIRHPTFEALVSQQITILIKLGRLEEALELCIKHEDNEAIVSQQITILIKLNRLEEALNICEYHSNFGPILSQQIKLLVRLKRYNEALDICNKHTDNIHILLQFIKILYNQERYDEALNICLNHGNDYSVNILKEKILSKINEKNEISSKETKSSSIDINYNLNKDILTRICTDDITLDEIEQLEIDEWTKKVLIIAYYDKNNKRKAIEFIKEINRVNLSSEQIKDLNTIREYLLNKKNINFNYKIYESILHCILDENINTSLVEESRITTDSNSDSIVEPKKEKQAKKKSMISIEGVKVNKTNTSSIKNHINETNKKCEHTETQLIKDLFYEEVMEIKKYLYVKMQLSVGIDQVRAVKAWDRFEVLVDKSTDDKEALKRMINFLLKLKSSELAFIVDEKKYEKYLKM